MTRTVQRFEVSLKAFIRRDGKALLVREADTGFWELPGGRIDVGEEWEPQSAVLARELREELGARFIVELGAEAETWMRQRPTDGAFLFNIARVGRHVAGEPELSAEHDLCGWFERAEALALTFPERSNYPDALSRLWRSIERSG